MVTLKGIHIYLRALEPEDISFLSDIENDERLWELSHTQTPYSQYILKEYLANSHQDIFEAKQLRLVISDYEDHPLGMIDLFDFDFKNSRAGVGILVKNIENRQKGYGKEALQLLINYCFTHLNLHQLYCNISEDNLDSIKLFTNQGFEKVGLKKDWTFHKNVYKNEYLLQLINR
ncbi:GNAT family N-acetyltransferase [Gelidibacter maritimus]|uniref:GNAT family N-acetyltransferase n=1 Tax=Gelidibacter maritimus TaxID=2761487 RepID=A0A7W2M1R1_9FLAO|nr:GNAT family protein [Gelidibacter maritimus]MBA6151114.1 GNAT family N-acetyltransferase [Gelidibacter maritimus]